MLTKRTGHKGFRENVLALESARKCISAGLTVLFVCPKPDFTSDIKAVCGILHTDVANNTLWRDGIIVVFIDAVFGIIN